MILIMNKETIGSRIVFYDCNRRKLDKIISGLVWENESGLKDDWVAKITINGIDVVFCTEKR